MKPTLSFFAILLSVGIANATKARNTALSNSFHLRGTQTVYTSPYHLKNLDNFVSFESGITSATSTGSSAEGSFLMNAGETGKLFMSLGHLDETTQPVRTFINTVGTYTFKPQQNAIEFIFSHKTESATFGYGVFYSNFNNKTVGSEEKESSNGLRVSGTHGALGWKLNLGLTNTAENTTVKMKGTLYANLGLRYKMDSTSFAFDYTTWGVKVETIATGATAQEHDFANIQLRTLNSTKVESNEIFYGAGFSQTNLKDKVTDKKLNRLHLPLILGFEAKATDWMMLRGSITQSILLTTFKDERGYPAVSGITTPATTPPTAQLEYSGEPNTTSVAVGAGLKFGKVTIDGTLKDLMTSSGGQKLDGSNLLAQVGVIYNY